MIEAKEKNQMDIELDPKGYFVIKPSLEDKLIYVEYYNYEKMLLEIIRGKNARTIYWTIIDYNWVSKIDHAAYLGKELMKAEYAITHNIKYEQN